MYGAKDGHGSAGYRNASLVSEKNSSTHPLSVPRHPYQAAQAHSLGNDRQDKGAGGWQPLPAWGAAGIYYIWNQQHAASVFPCPDAPGAGAAPRTTSSHSQP